MRFDRNVFSRGLAMALIALMLTGTGMLAGCAAKETGSSIDDNSIEQQEAESKIISDFDALLAASPQIDTVIWYIDNNIENTSKDNAAMMVSKLEELQKIELPKLEEKYYAEAIQNELQKVYKPAFDLSKLDEIQATALKDVLIETRDKGYKVETAEGMFFPVMNYEFHKKYSTYMSEDMKQYIDLMAIESNVTPIKDAALMIGWEEIVKRALAQEQFIKNFAGSAKVEDVKQLQKRYITFMLYGANNTPLFSYETKIMVPEAKTVYLDAVKDNSDSEVMQILGSYMDILKKSDYKLSEEAEAFRKNY